MGRLKSKTRQRIAAGLRTHRVPEWELMAPAMTPLRIAQILAVAANDAEEEKKPDAVIPIVAARAIAHALQTRAPLEKCCADPDVSVTSERVQVGSFVHCRCTRCGRSGAIPVIVTWNELPVVSAIERKALGVIVKMNDLGLTPEIAHALRISLARTRRLMGKMLARGLVCRSDGPDGIGWCLDGPSKAILNPAR